MRERAHGETPRRSSGGSRRATTWTAYLAMFLATGALYFVIGLLSTATDWALCGVIILVATLGKFGGSFVAG